MPGIYLIANGGKYNGRITVADSASWISDETLVLIGNELIRECFRERLTITGIRIVQENSYAVVAEVDQEDRINELRDKIPRFVPINIFDRLIMDRPRLHLGSFDDSQTAERHRQSMIRSSPCFQISGVSFF
jgi:hypothetical protein